MPRYMDTHEVPPDVTEAEIKKRLERLAELSSAFGVRGVETFYNVALGRIHCIIEAVDEESVVEAHEGSDLPVTGIMPVECVYTELLHEPRRDRYA